MKLIFIHYSVGHWLKVAGFGECKFSTFPGLPNRQENRFLWLEKTQRQRNAGAGTWKRGWTFLVWEGEGDVGWYLGTARPATSFLGFLETIAVKLRVSS